MTVDGTDSSGGEPDGLSGAVVGAFAKLVSLPECLVSGSAYAGYFRVTLVLAGGGHEFSLARLLVE
jgi:hypothetical protein